jgi:hypothetical protein
MTITRTHRVAGGTLATVTHDSAVTGTPMQLTVFTPPGDGAAAGGVRSLVLLREHVLGEHVAWHAGRLG